MITLQAFANGCPKNHKMRGGRIQFSASGRASQEENHQRATQMGVWAPGTHGGVCTLPRLYGPTGHRIVVHSIYPVLQKCRDKEICVFFFPDTASAGLPFAGPPDVPLAKSTYLSPELSRPIAAPLAVAMVPHTGKQREHRQKHDTLPRSGTVDWNAPLTRLSQPAEFTTSACP